MANIFASFYVRSVIDPNLPLQIVGDGKLLKDSGIWIFVKLPMQLYILHCLSTS